MPGRTRRAAPAPAAGGLLAEVNAALDALREQLAPEDVAAAELARRYAQTLDNAEVLAEAAARIPYDPDTAAAVARLRQRVDAHVAMVELGPKLLACLDALMATPGARARVTKPRTAPPAAGKLGQLRAAAG